MCCDAVTARRRTYEPDQRSCLPNPHSSASTRQSLRCQSPWQAELVNATFDRPFHRTDLAILKGFPLLRVSRAASSSASRSMRSASLLINFARWKPLTFLPQVVLKASRAEATARSMSLAEPVPKRMSAIRKQKDAAWNPPRSSSGDRHAKLDKVQCLPRCR